MTFRQFLFQLFIGLFVCAAVYYTINNRFENPEAILGDDTELLLYNEMDTETLVDLMRASELDFDEDEFVWAAEIIGIDRFLSGRYLISKGVRYKDFMGKLHRGEEDPKMVIIHPGQTYERFYARIASQFRFTADELMSTMRDSTYIREELELEPKFLFGRMIPNTYEFYWTASPQQFLQRILTEFDRATSGFRDRAAELNLTIDEVITMASIVELEAMYDHEKPKIAGLYWNRINQNWRLQADPTVNYALGRRGRLTFADYRFRHPYNTYTIHGLPPGPITNPAMPSIRAVLEPENHPYMFMVATPDGVHTFTRTYAEHRRESAKWRDFLRERDRQRRIQEEERKRQEEIRSATL